MWKNKLAEKGNRHYGEIDFSQFQTTTECDKTKKALDPSSSVYTMNIKGNNKNTLKNIKSKSPEVLKIYEYNTEVIDIKSKYLKAKTMNINSQILSKQFESFMKQKREQKQQQQQ
ncbi:unnamed protein product [Paramecium sonneborni]|uniref:Uncharacterized protein n=1 Tax=Paramecium sonneborni TaxID=65129 RepID=A0A8S1MTI0_9CILI|nr:unnamed protein product [Paramecium sonneborni]